MSVSALFRLCFSALLSLAAAAPLENEVPEQMDDPIVRTVQ
jgi:hypothetical protein